MDEPLVIRTRSLFERMIFNGWWVWALVIVALGLWKTASGSSGPGALLAALGFIALDGGYAFYTGYRKVSSIRFLPEGLRLKTFKGQATRVPYDEIGMFVEDVVDRPFGTFFSGRVSGVTLYRSEPGKGLADMDRKSSLQIAGLEPGDLARFVAELEKRVGLCAWGPRKGSGKRHIPMGFIAPMVAGVDKDTFEAVHLGLEPSYRWADSWATAEAVAARKSLECGACGKLRRSVSWFTDDHGRLRASCTECRKASEAARRDRSRATSDADDHWLTAVVLVGLAKTTLQDPLHPPADTARLALLLGQAAWNRSVGEALPPAFQDLLGEVTRSDPGVWNAFRRSNPDALLDDLQREVESRFPDNRRPIVNFQMTQGGVVEAAWGDAA